MRTEVAIAFPDWRKKWKRVRVRYYNGKPYELDDLLKVAVYAAERVIVLGCSRQPRVADSQILTTICALRCLPGNKTLNPATSVIAELKQRQTGSPWCSTSVARARRCPRRRRRVRRRTRAARRRTRARRSRSRRWWATSPPTRS